MATESFLREARDKLDSKEVDIHEKEVVIEKLWHSKVSLEHLVKSPLIGKAVRTFYRKVAPKNTRVWTMSGKVYYKMKKQLLESDHEGIIKAMEGHEGLQVIVILILIAMAF